MFIYRIYQRPSAEYTGQDYPWSPVRIGHNTSPMLEWTDKTEAETYFAGLVEQEKQARADMNVPLKEKEWVPFPHQPTEFRLVRIYADEVKEFK